MTGEIIDSEALARLRDAMGGSDEDLAELIGDFVEIAPDMASSIRRALEAGDLAACGIEAHSLKSSARDMGAARLSAPCAELERLCKAGEDEGTGSAVDRIDAALAEALAALRALEPRDV